MTNIKMFFALILLPFLFGSGQQSENIAMSTDTFKSVKNDMAMPMSELDAIRKENDSLSELRTKKSFLIISKLQKLIRIKTQQNKPDTVFILIPENSQSDYIPDTLYERPQRVDTIYLPEPKEEKKQSWLDKILNRKKQ